MSPGNPPHLQGPIPPCFLLISDLSPNEAEGPPCRNSDPTVCNTLKNSSLIDPDLILQWFISDIAILIILTIWIWSCIATSWTLIVLLMVIFMAHFILTRKFSIVSHIPAKRILMNILISIIRVFIVVKLQLYATM